MREEVTEKERDKHFNTIRPVILTKQEWRVKKKVDAPAPTNSDDGMDLLDDDDGPLIKDGVSATDRHGHQHGVHADGRVQGR
jgi:hypothetical protein